MRKPAFKAVIDDHQVEDIHTQVIFQYLDMFFGREFFRLADLGGNVADIEFQRPAGKQRSFDIRYEQVWQDAGIQAAWSNQDEIGCRIAWIAGG